MVSCFFFICSFDKILSLNFDLGFLKVKTYCFEKINFTKDYEKDSYNIKNWWGKKKEKKDQLGTLKKTHIKIWKI
jgi:hypothetical protein